MDLSRLSRAVALAAVLAGTPPAWGAPAPIDEPDASAEVATGFSGARADYALNTEMVVHDWVLCASRSLAEVLLRAHDESRDVALRTYADLTAQQACGRFAELRVILNEQIGSAAVASGDTRAFSALVRVADQWAAAFVLTGAVADDAD